MFPVAVLLLMLTVVCAVGPVAINMAALQLKAKAVAMDSIEQDLKAQVRDVEAQIATLNSTAHLQEEVEKLGMESASSFSYLESTGLGSGGGKTAETVSGSETAGVIAQADGGQGADGAEEADGAEADGAGADGIGATLETGVAWLETAGSGANGSNTAQNR